MTKKRKMKTLFQCDFDGTITEQDASFFLLDAYAQGDWRQLLRQYKQHKISVGEFNTKAFAMVKASQETLLETIRGKVKIRAGFQELVTYCTKRGFRFVIVSNGLAFYIKAILQEIGLANIEVYAAEAWFHPEGMEVQYIGPDGNQLGDGFKEAYIKLFLKQGYRLIYAGNGDSDIYPAGYAYRIFATGDLLNYYRQNNLKCQAFSDLSDIIKALRLL